MKNLELTVRVYFHGEYENTETRYIEIPKDTPEDKEMEVMMNELNPQMEDAYDDYEEWETGDISWTLHSWETCLTA